MKRILVVDDDNNIRCFVSEFLEMAGYEVTLAINGKDGLNKLNSSTYDLVIADINMPYLDGIGLYKLAVKHSHLKNKFLFITGDYSSKPESWVFNSIDLNFLTKPFRVEQLIHKVKILLSLNDGSQ